MPDPNDTAGLVPGDEYVDSAGMPRFDDSPPDLDPHQFYDGHPQGEDAPTAESDARDLEAFKASFGHLPQEALSPEEAWLAEAFGEGKQAEAAEKPAEKPAAEEEPSTLTATEQASRERAIAALRRAKQSPDDFKTMEIAIERGLQLAEVQAETDAKFQERRKENAERTSSTPGLPAVAPGQTEDHTQFAAELEDALTEVLGDEGKGIGTKLSQALSAADERTSKQLDTLVGWLVDSELRQARAADPRLKADTVWGPVKAAFDRISDSASYQGLEGLHQAIEDAKSIALKSPATSAAAHSEAKALNDRKAAGAPTDPNRVVGPSPGDSHLASEVEGFRNAFKLSQAHNVRTFGQAGLGM